MLSISFLPLFSSGYYFPYERMMLSSEALSIFGRSIHPNAWKGYSPKFGCSKTLSEASTNGRRAWGWLIRQPGALSPLQWSRGTPPCGAPRRLQPAEPPRGARALWSRSKPKPRYRHSPDATRRSAPSRPRRVGSDREPPRPRECRAALGLRRASQPGPPPRGLARVRARGRAIGGRRDGPPRA